MKNSIIILLFLALTIDCSKRQISLEKAIDNHIRFELSDPTLMENQSIDSVVFVGLVFDHSDRADSLKIVASYLPPFWFSTTETYLGVKQTGQRVFVYSTDCPQDTFFLSKLKKFWLPSEIDTSYSRYLSYFNDNPGKIEHYLINISTYEIVWPNHLVLADQRKKRWPRR